jgi:hypothetical protein
MALGGDSKQIVIIFLCFLPIKLSSFAQSATCFWGHNLLNRGRGWSSLNASGNKLTRKFWLANKQVLENNFQKIMTNVDTSSLLALSNKIVKQHVETCQANLGFVGNQSHDVLINCTISFPGKFVMDSASIKSPIESLVVSHTILTHQVVEYRINLTQVFFPPKNKLCIQIPMTWFYTYSSNWLLVSCAILAGISFPSNTIANEKTIQVLKILLPVRDIANLQFKPSITRALQQNTCLAQEAVSTRRATKQVVEILGTKYKKAHIPAIIGDNCSHLDASEIRETNHNAAQI